MIRRGIGVQSFVSAGVSTDADAQAFITAAGITDATQQSAINTLVVDLKTYGIWTKMKAIYPFVGGTASAHKFNLKDPRDMDAAFRLVFSGGWTHSSSGAKVNGINAYANTYFNLNNFTSTNAGASVYRNAMTNGGSDIATYAGSNTSIFYNAWSSNLQTVAAFSNNGTLNYADTSGLGLYTTNALSGTTKGYRNGVVKLTNTTQGAPPNVNSQIGRNTYGVEYADSRYGFAAYHDGLTDTEAANLYTAVQAYQTTLSRNV
jgi:hypothetical protein